MNSLEGLGYFLRSLEDCSLHSPSLGSRADWGRGRSGTLHKLSPAPTPVPALGSSKLWKDFEWATPSSSVCLFLRNLSRFGSPLPQGEILGQEFISFSVASFTPVS